MVPDVAANADPGTGDKFVVHGEHVSAGGTSAVAPLYAGLFAAFGTKLGFVTPKLWANHLCFNDIIEGDNGFYRARIGPDPCTGIGSPIGTKLAALLAASAVPTSTHGQSPDSVPTDWSGTITYTYAGGELVSTSKLQGRSRIRVKR
jgi:subtilase family serine protease